MSDNDDAFPGQDDFQEERVGEALADYLSLVEETITAQVSRRRHQGQYPPCHGPGGIRAGQEP